MQLDMSGVGLPSSAAEPKEMLTVSRLGEVTKVSINFSSLALFQTCWRKAELTLIRGLKPSMESPALLFGTALHKGLEVYYSGQRTERLIPSDYAEIMQMIGCSQWQPTWEEHLVFRAARAFVLKAAPLSELPDANKRSISTGVWMLQAYFETYLTDEYVIMRDKHGPVVERRVRMNIHEEPGLVIEMHGQIDFVMQNEVTGQVLPGDHKSSSSLYDFYSKAKPNFQYVMYSKAVREVLGYNTDLFLVNALEVKPPPKTARGTKPNFARQIVECNDMDFDECKYAIVETVKLFLRYQEAGHFPMSATGACTASYGTCVFHEVCSAPPVLRENIIAAKFVTSGYKA